MRAVPNMDSFRKLGIINGKVSSEFLEDNNENEDRSPLSEYSKKNSL